MDPLAMSMALLAVAVATTYGAIGSSASAPPAFVAATDPVMRALAGLGYIGWHFYLLGDDCDPTRMPTSLLLMHRWAAVTRTSALE